MALSIIDTIRNRSLHNLNRDGDGHEAPSGECPFGLFDNVEGGIFALAEALLAEPPPRQAVTWCRCCGDGYCQAEIGGDA